METRTEEAKFECLSCLARELTTKQERPLKVVWHTECKIKYCFECSRPAIATVHKAA